MKMKKLFGTIAVLALAASASSQPPYNDKLDSFFNRLAEKNKAMGSLVMAKDGKTLYARAIGYSEVGETEKKRMTGANRFRIGSVTKTFTAALIMQLVDEGKLKLADTLSQFFPELPNANKITIGQILAHRSGIPDISRTQNGKGNMKTIPMSREEYLALIVKASPNFEPGTKTLYSNAGYFVLGLVIERLTGDSYGHALQEKISKRIGLPDTYLATGAIDPGKKEALTYFMVPGGDWKQVPETHPSLLFSAGAIVSTPRDLAKFIHALFEGKIVSKKSLDLMTSLVDGEGFGLVTFTFGGKTFYGHTGGADNYGAWLAYQPEEKLAIAYTTNAKVYPVKDIIGGIADIYYNRPFQVPSFGSIAVSLEILDSYAGVYSPAGAAARFTISREGGTLYAQPPGTQNPVPLEATGPDTFRIDNGTPTGIVFQFDPANKRMTIRRDGGERVFTKQE